jgi:hypothetical protein
MESIRVDGAGLKGHDHSNLPRRECDLVERAIFALERIARGGARRRGRYPSGSPL